MSDSDFVTRSEMQQVIEAAIKAAIDAFRGEAFEFPDVYTQDDVAAAQRRLIMAAARGEISVNLASQMMHLLNAYAYNAPRHRPPQAAVLRSLDP